MKLTVEEINAEIAIVHEQMRPLQQRLAKLFDEKEILMAEDCRACDGGKLLSSGLGGGVHCNKCTYWFCY